MPEPAAPAPPPLLRRFAPRARQMRLIVHSRRVALGILPLGALSAWAMTWLLRGMASIERPVEGFADRHPALILLLPVIGVGLTTLWLHLTRIGEASLVDDLERAHENPEGAFAPRATLAKIAACGLTIGLGGSAGVEGPAKWFGAGLGLQYHRALRRLSRKLRPVRKALSRPLVSLTAGAAAALTTVFRAPLSGALLAAEQEGSLPASEQIPALAAAAAGYTVHVLMEGHRPLLAAPPAELEPRELGWALALGTLAAVAIRLHHALDGWLRRGLVRVPLWGRGAVGGLGLSALAWLSLRAAPSPVPFTYDGGMPLIARLLAAPADPAAAGALFALKLAATTLTFASGGLGGRWLPTLTIGAALGGALAGFAGLPAPVFILAGAAAYAGAFHRTVLLPAVFLAEATGRSEYVVPGLLAAVMAFLITQ